MQTKGWLGSFILILCMTCFVVAAFNEQAKRNQKVTPVTKPGTQKVLVEQTFPGERCDPALTVEEEMDVCLCTVRIQRVRKVGKDLRTTISTVFSLDRESCETEQIETCASQ